MKKQQRVGDRVRVVRDYEYHLGRIAKITDTEIKVKLDKPFHNVKFIVYKRRQRCFF